MMLTADTPRDFVLLTGILHRLSFSFFVQRSLAAAGITDWQSYVVTSESDRPVYANRRVENRRSAYLVLGWRRTVDFDGIAARMVQHDIAEPAQPQLFWTDL